MNDVAIGFEEGEITCMEHTIRQYHQVPGLYHANSITGGKMSKVHCTRAGGESTPSAGQHRRTFDSRWIGTQNIYELDVIA